MKYVTLLSLTILILLTMIGCDNECYDQQLEESHSGVCADVYRPVCGCDGKTYGNACEAIRSGIPVVEHEACN